MVPLLKIPLFVRYTAEELCWRLTLITRYDSAETSLTAGKLTAWQPE